MICDNANSINLLLRSRTGSSKRSVRKRLKRALPRDYPALPTMTTIGTRARTGSGIMNTTMSLKKASSMKRYPKRKAIRNQISRLLKKRARRLRKRSSLNLNQPQFKNPNLLNLSNLLRRWIRNWIQKLKQLRKLQKQPVMRPKICLAVP